jgi:ribosomal protein L24
VPLTEEREVFHTILNQYKDQYEDA